MEEGLAGDVAQETRPFSAHVWHLVPLGAFAAEWRSCGAALAGHAALRMGVTGTKVGGRPIQTDVKKRWCEDLVPSGSSGLQGGNGTQAIARCGKIRGASDGRWRYRASRSEKDQRCIQALAFLRASVAKGF